LAEDKREKIRLTSLTCAGGWASKMGPEDLALLLEPLKNLFPPERFPRLKVGLDVSDDAAVYELENHGGSIVLTLDFFPPVVDEPIHFGRIAAVNAMSDVYAMGGRPIFALNISAFPANMSLEDRRAIMIGGAEKVSEAGAAIAGGHTMESIEPLYGLVVVGFLKDGVVFTKGGAEPGDYLVLTKPLGAGIVTQALKSQKAEDKHVEIAMDSMEKLNGPASQIFADAGVKSCTDITGFSLMGHSLEMAEESDVVFNFRLPSLPFLPGAVGYSEQWLFPGGTQKNMNAYSSKVSFSPGIPDNIVHLLYTPETSGGLLASVNRGLVDGIMADLKEAGVDAAIVGVVEEGSGIRVTD